MSSVSITFDRAALREALGDLREQVQEAARPAAQAGAEVLYRAVLRNVDMIGEVSGNLRSAIYQVFSKDNSGPGLATYHVSWNTRKAPHGHLLEFGWIQRYAVYVGKDGKWHTAVRSEMQGKPKPKRRASQSEKAAYYVLRPKGPVQHPARAFVGAARAQESEALAAAEARFFQLVTEKK